MPRGLTWAVAGLAAIAVLALGAGGWYYSDQLLPAPQPADPERTVEVVVTDPASRTVTFEDGDDELLGLGTVGMVGADGVLVLDGPASDVGDHTSRTATLIDGRWPEPGTRVGPSVDTFVGDPATTLGVPFEPVDVPSELGVLPAWRIEPNGSETNVWVVLVHGRGAALSQTNRLLPVLDELELPSLTISVRNDPNAPAGEDGYGYYGEREWEDLEAAVEYLVATEGAERIVLAGVSQGGSIALGFLRRSPHADLVEAAVLVSPLVSLHETLVLQARARDIPDPLIPPLLVATKLISTWRAGIDFSEVEHLEQLDGLAEDVPILLTHGRDDETVPVGPSRKLARARPQQVVYEEYADAGHVREWNVDRDRFEADLREFLDAEVLAPTG